VKKSLDPRIIYGASMAIFGTISPFIRNIDMPSAEIALYRAVMAIAFIGVLMLFTHRSINVKNIKKEVPLLLFSGFALGINWILLFEAYRHTTVAIATLSYYFAPVLVTLVCPFLFKEKLTAKQILCFIMSTLGLVLVIGVGGASGKDLAGILFGLGAALLYATVVLLNKFIKNVEGIQRSFFQFVAALVVLLPYVLLSGGITLGTLSGKGWIFLLIVGLVHTGFTYYIYFNSLKELPGQEAAVLSYIDPVVAVIVSVTILGESMTVWQVIGGVLILGFTLYNEISLPGLKKKK